MRTEIVDLSDMARDSETAQMAKVFSKKPFHAHARAEYLGEQYRRKARGQPDGAKRFGSANKKPQENAPAAFCFSVLFSDQFGSV